MDKDGKPLSLSLIVKIQARIRGVLARRKVQSAHGFRTTMLMGKRRK
jgi:hypothetical protein